MHSVSKLLNPQSPIPVHQCEAQEKKTMNENENKVEKPNPERIKALKSLPQDLMERLTKEEVHAFLFDEVWPDSLQEKLKDYLVEEE